MSMRRLGAWGGAGLVALALPLGAQTPLAAQGSPGQFADGGFAAGVPVAPQFPFVTLDQAKFFSESQYGQRLLAELASRQAELAAENRRIEAQLADRERLLTTERPKLSAEAFRTLADRFNTEVERHRQEQAAKEREIYQTHERDRALFQDLSNQALVGLMRDIGALAIIAEEAIVLGFRDIDITEGAIARLDALVGDGSALPHPDRPTVEGAGPDSAAPGADPAPKDAGGEDVGPEAVPPETRPTDSPGGPQPLPSVPSGPSGVAPQSTPPSQSPPEPHSDQAPKPGGG